MVWEKLKEELIIPGLEAKSSDDIFEALGGNCGDVSSVAGRL